MTRKHYLFRLHKTNLRYEEHSPDYRLGYQNGLRFWSDYVLSNDEAMLIEDANDAASWLVAGERIMTARHIRFQRAVAFELAEGESITVETPVYTFVAAPVIAGEYGSPLLLRGLRVPSGTPAAFGLDTDMVSVAVNREKGRRWIKYFAASVGPDDIVSRAHVEPSPHRAGAWHSAWRVAGSAAQYCVPWYAWSLTNVPGLDFSVEAGPLGQIAPVAPPLPGVHLHLLSHFHKLRRWQHHKRPGLLYLDQLWNEVDTLVSAALATQRVPQEAWDRWAGRRMLGEDAFLRCADLWQQFAALLGYTVPEGARRGVPTFFPFTYSPSVHGVHPKWDDYPVPPDPGQGEVPDPPEVPEVLPLTENQEQVFFLVNRLFELHQWYWRSFDCRYYTRFRRAWLHAADGTPWQEIPLPPKFRPYWSGGGWLVDSPLRDTAARIVAEMHPAARAYIVDSGHPYLVDVWFLPLIWDETYEYERRYMWLEYERWDELAYWAHEIIRCLNLLQVFLQPKQARPRLTLKQMEMPVEEFPEAPEGARSLPEQLELVPYMHIPRPRRPLWMNRPGSEPPDNVAQVYIPLEPTLPKTITQPAPPYESEYDETNEPEDWVSGKAFLRGEARDWIDAYPRKGLFDGKGGLRDIYGSGGGLRRRP